MRFRNISTHDPFRFEGDGVDFKAKLIGSQDVDEPRGDQMCQDAIQTCKASVKRKGEHKLRILFNVSLEGLKIKEQHGGKVLHTFPVAKVSFIAKDISDNRAFGFVYGTTEDQHKFYGIKTEKTADQVVFSIRDMFQIVYEMKKKQIEQAKQQQLNKEQHLQDDENVANGVAVDADRHANGSDEVPVANLLDLETELENLEQGMQHMEKWTATFEDSTENSSSHSPSSPPSGLTLDSSGWATTSLSSSALNESNDPFNDHLFTSSTNSFGSAGPKEPFVPPPPVSSNSRRASHPNGHSTLFGGGPDPFSDPFENGFSRTISNSSNVFIMAQHASGSSSTTDPFDTSHVSTMMNGRNANNLLNVTTTNGVTPLIVSTPLQAKVPGGAWLSNGVHQQPPPSLLDSSQCLSAIQPNTFDDFSSNGSGTFAALNRNLSTSKMESSSMFNNAATDSSVFQMSSSNGHMHDSLLNGELFNGSRYVNGGTTSSPLSISNSSGSQSPRSPSVSKPNSLGRSLTNGSIVKSSNGVDAINMNGHHINNVDDAYAKLCNLDTLVITPSRSPQQSNGFLVHESLSTPPKRDDPFAHLKHKPKKTINELREMAVGPSLNGLETLCKNYESPKDVRSSPMTITTSSSWSTNENGASPPRPPIPPRSGQNFPAIPRPDVGCGLGSRSLGSNGLHQRGLLPPPVCGAKIVESKHDPFADEFFA